MAFKIGKTSKSNANDTGKEKVAKIGPGRNSPAINEERSDEVPDHPPEIKWPSVPVDHKPFKLTK